MAKPAIYPPEHLVAALERAARTENARRGEGARVLTWQDIARALLAHVLHVQDSTPGGLDVPALLQELGIAPPSQEPARARKTRRVIPARKGNRASSAATVRTA